MDGRSVALPVFAFFFAFKLINVSDEIRIERQEKEGIS